MKSQNGRPKAARRRAVEGPTLALAGLIYGGFLAVTFWHDSMPWWLFAAVATWLVAWQSSLQHEILHGHPTRSRGFNRMLGMVPLSLWLPYETYRLSHLSHHRDDRLTDPLDDPESRYLTPEDWTRLGPLGRWMLTAQKTLAGRLVLGPAWMILHFLGEEAAKIRDRDRLTRRIWAEHVLWTVPVVAWIVLVCRIDLGFYILAVIYPSVSLLLIRSFAEHKAADGVAERTAIVENSTVFGLLFLHNNLHAVHHERPAMPWYEIPAWYRENRARLLLENGGHVYDGYGEVFRRFLFASHDSVVHPVRRHPAPAREAASLPADNLLLT
ncbi:MULTISPECIES: fatty acid desaturase [unclassified Aureimonas]|uniref:fatty acid desaturase n=1 Tax=unclassified Aureimonas TaxID=2615206 RepID=UPI0006F2CF6A|nr:MULTISPECIES: fatty acid desaturase [unclassified Aureimonas]KQT52750.1 fatty acid desaturase [Aureimonas sp. Leaf427]KQT80210.1 fatty acid desaturase [Aureimonas sp. Leaf460]